jgi:hypothetical protein
VAHGRAHPRSLNAIGRRCQRDRFATGQATPPVPLRGPSPDTACHAGDMFESPQVGFPLLLDHHREARRTAGRHSRALPLMLDSLVDEVIAIGDDRPGLVGDG